MKSKDGNKINFKHFKLAAEFKHVAQNHSVGWSTKKGSIHMQFIVSLTKVLRKRNGSGLLPVSGRF